MRYRVQVSVIGLMRNLPTSPVGCARRYRSKYNVTYVNALDGGVWELGPEGSEWFHIP
jgi:hypothetical protein